MQSVSSPDQQTQQQRRGPQRERERELAVREAGMKLVAASVAVPFGIFALGHLGFASAADYTVNVGER